MANKPKTAQESQETTTENVGDVNAAQESQETTTENVGDVNAAQKSQETTTENVGDVNAAQESENRSIGARGIDSPKGFDAANCLEKINKGDYTNAFGILVDAYDEVTELTAEINAIQATNEATLSDSRPLMLKLLQAAGINEVGGAYYLTNGGGNSYKVKLENNQYVVETITPQTLPN